MFDDAAERTERADVEGFLILEVDMFTVELVRQRDAVPPIIIIIIFILYIAKSIQFKALHG